MSDHFEFNGDSWGGVNNEYKGPWHPTIRDIDPSFILHEGYDVKKSADFSRWKSKYGHYDAWAKKKSDVDWMKDVSDLPRPETVIQITDDNKNIRLMLEGFIQWEEETPPEHKKYDIPIREVWYMVKSYIVKRKDAKKFASWAKKQDFMGDWMPKSYSFYDVFLGEYPNSLAFEDSRGGHDTWTRSGRGSKDLPAPVLVTDDAYSNGFSLDCSREGSTLVKLPSKWLTNEMGLHHENADGNFLDKNNNIVTFSINISGEDSPSVVLIDKQRLSDFLISNGYAIFWTLLGEKQVIGGNHSREDFTGRLEISGSYTLDSESNIVGESHSEFVQ